jgi:hypothetical protein
MLVSDASGQMAATDKPSAGTLSVPLRAFSVSMARVRQAEYHELDARRRTSALRGLMFLHLKKDLDVNPIDWVECQDPHDASDDARPVDRRGVLTRYGIRKDVQERLAAIRTDLDSFSEVEAFALMTSGYRMAQREFKRTIEGFATPPQTQPQWRFLEIETLLGPERASPQVLKRLSVGSRVALKVWQLSKPLMVVGLMLAAALLGGLAWAVIKWRETPVVTVGQLVWSVLGFLAAFVVPPLAIRLLRYRETLGQFGLVTAGAVLVSVVFRFYLVFLDPIFLRLGRLSAVKKSASRSEKGSLT